MQLYSDLRFLTVIGSYTQKHQSGENRETSQFAICGLRAENFLLGGFFLAKTWSLVFYRVAECYANAKYRAKLYIVRLAHARVILRKCRLPP